MTNPSAFHTIAHLQRTRREFLLELDRIRKISNSQHLMAPLFHAHIKPLLSLYYPAVSPLAGCYGCRVYRCRPSSLESPFAEISDLLNPPAPTGRARGTSSNPVLYASASLQTCLSELSPMIGDVFAVVQLDYSTVKDLNFWFVGQHLAFSRSGAPSPYLADRNAVHLPAYYPSAVQHAWTFCDSLIDEVFSDISSEADDYELNRLVIQELTRKKPELSIAGLLFNSTKCVSGTNFAFFGDAIEQVEPRIVNLIRIEDIDEYGYIASRVLKNSKPKGRHLDWPADEMTGT